MRTLSRKSGTLRPTEILRERSKIKAQKTLAMKIREDQTLRLSNDPVQFFRQIVGFEPPATRKILSSCLWRTSLRQAAGVTARGEH